MISIGVDIREAVSKNKAGKGVYAFNIIDNLISQLKSTHKLFFFLDDNTDIDIPMNWKLNKQIQFITFKKSFFWHKKVAQQVKDLGLTHFFSPTSYITPYYISNLSKDTKVVVTIHDLIVYKYPQSHTLKPKILEKFYLRKIINLDNIYFSFVSQATKKDFLQVFLNIDLKKRTFVATNGVNTQKIPHKVSSAKLFILSVSTVIPRKNYLNLIKALNFIKQVIPHKLVIVGGHQPSNLKKIQKYIKQNNLADRVEFTGFISSKKLQTLYSKADMLVIPSLYEGFGLPVLEGLDLGLPVLCSDIPPFKEVGGDIAIYFNPNNPVDIANQIIFTAKNEEQKQIFQIEGPKQAQKFSWKKSAKIIYEYLS